MLLAETAPPQYPVSGYDFVRAVIDQRGSDAVETLIRIAHGGETDWLEKKAAVYVSAENDYAFRAKLGKLLENCPADVVARETQHYETELLRSIACALVALHNSRGGVLFIGVDDANKPVPFGECDGDGILAKEGLEAYVRKSVLGRIFPKGGFFECGRANWTVPTEFLGVIPRICQYRGVNVLALLVPALKPGQPPILVTKIENNHPRKLLFQRKPGDIGEVRSSEQEMLWADSAAALANFHDDRTQAFLSRTDLCGELQKLAIEPPSPELSTTDGKGTFRQLYKILTAALLVSLLAGFSIMAFLRIGKQSEPDPLDTIREGIRSGKITVYTPETARELVRGITKDVGASTHQLSKDLDSIRTESRRNTERGERMAHLKLKEGALEQAVYTASWNAGVIWNACVSSTESDKAAKAFLDRIQKFEVLRRDAERGRERKVQTVETDEEFTTLLSEINLQKKELRQLLEQIPEVAPKDENKWSKSGNRAGQSRENLLNLRASLEANTP